MDTAAVMGQFLKEVELADLVIELVQNDLDAGATRTVIDFGADALICEGDGRPIDRKGWRRLESVLAAGGEIDAKKDGIGSKNHGLRTAFLMADRIGVQSGGARADLTVRGDRARPSRFRPGFWPRMEDSEAPARGTRVIAPYRTKPLRVTDGDNTVLLPLSADALDKLWTTAKAEAPERFLTASAPGARWRYTLVLKRYGNPDCEFHYECTPLTGPLRGLWLRTCKIRDGEKPLRTVARRHAMRFPADVTDGGKIPRLFRKRVGISGELSWDVDRSGRPTAALGRLRYPIAFPGREARTGHGFDISAPFVGGRARHTVSNDPRNDSLIEQGRGAMAKAGARLAAAYGPALGALVRSEEPRASDRQAERALAQSWLEQGGLSVARFGPGALPPVKGSAALAAGESLLLPLSVRGAEPIKAMLCSLASRHGAPLSPETPAPLVELLAEIEAHGHRQLTVFDEQLAAGKVLTEELKAGFATTGVEIDRAKAALACLESLSKAGGLPGELTSALTARGALPAYHGKAVAWRAARRHDQEPPEIPGVVSPSVIHLAFKDAPILNRPPLRLRRFNLDDFVGGLDWSKAGESYRLPFFAWLRESASGLKRTTLSRIAAYPVWPGADGKARELAAYCRSRGRMLNILGGSLLAPSLAVVELARVLPSRALRLRVEPTDAELVAWHASSMAAIAAEPDAAQARAKVDTLEADLDWLRSRLPQIVKLVAPQHKTLSQAGALEPVKDLHLPNDIVLACGLPPAALCRVRRASLYESLGAQPRPSAAVILKALLEDPDPVKLYIRLETYAASGLELSTLGSQRIIPIDGEAYAPDQLAFAGDPDVWGQWKTRLHGDDVAHHHHVLSRLGVMRARLTREGSVAFFRWLATQDRPIQEQHQIQISRHWRDPQCGPQSWSGALEVPCVPVTGGGQAFALISLSQAKDENELIYLDDFPEIRQEILKMTKARLTLNKPPGAQYSSLDAYAAIGAHSLRSAVGPPRAIKPGAALTLAPGLEQELLRLKSGPVLGRLKARLPLHDVSLSELKKDWVSLLKGLKGVRLCASLTAVHRFLGKPFEIVVQSGVDEASGLVILGADTDQLNELYAAVAAHLFQPGTSPRNAWGLMRAARDHRQLDLFTVDEELGDDDADTSNGEGEEGGSGRDDSTSGDVHKGHGLPKSKMMPVVPDPKPLGEISSVTQAITKPARKNTNPSKRRDSTMSIEEEEQKRELKHGHYAYHCQACIGAMDVLKATPPGTYVFAPGYRERILHAHHAHQKQNQGILGGKNLLILCEYHHRAWGDHLSREKVLAALEAATPVRRHFPRDAAGKELRRQDGLLAVPSLDIAPFEARLYFTKAHALAWRGGTAASSNGSGEL
jgi:hypothetical protein